MVLDHLVVQQMGKDNGEGEIDSMLLHGAAALYESNDHGVAASDIQYTSQNVDELIDKVEADADAEVNALEDKEEAVARGVVAADASNPKEAMSFGFAKIWESNQNKLEELQQKEDRPEDLANAWQLVMENAEKERRALLAETLKDGRRVKRLAATVKYPLAGNISDDGSPSKGKGKSKARAKVKHGKQINDSSDAEYALGHGQSESDTDSIASLREGPEDLGDAQGASTIRGLAAGKQQMSNKERRDIDTARARVMEQSVAASKLVPNAELSTVHGPNGISKPNAVPGPSTYSKKATFFSTPEQRARRKAQRQAHRENKQGKQHTRFRAYGTAPQTLATQFPSSNVPDMARGPQSPFQHVPNQAKIQAGQDAIQYMYQIIRELSMSPYIIKWGFMALPELPPAERKSIYLALAHAIDDQLHMRQLERYFANSETWAAVSHVFDCGAVVVSDAPRDRIVPPLPVEAKRWKDQNMPSSVAHPAYQQHLPSPIGSPELFPPTNGIAAPATRPPPHLYPSSLLAELPPEVQQSPTHSTGSILEGSLNPIQPQTCSYCGKAHSVRQCSDILTVADLETYRSIILESDEPEADMVSVVSAVAKFADMPTAA